MKRAITYVLCAALCSFAACDPVVDNAINDLGGDGQGSRPGPTHRPGQPCLLCHDGLLGDPTEFSVAGTVFLEPSSSVGANRATVELQNADGTKIRTNTNSAGNFYLNPGVFKPKYPMQVKVYYRGSTVTMHSTIGREGSCAGCHADPPGPDSPGRVYITLDDGGVPP